MTSPANISILTTLSIDRSATKDLYLQIVEQLANAIQRGLLREGSKLPGSRSLSVLLKVHRQTVVAAFQELESQGWVQTYPNRGVFVLSSQLADPARLQPEQIASPKQHYPSRVGFTFKKSNILDNPWTNTISDFTMDDGVPDIRLTQINQLSTFYSANLKRKSNRKKLERYTSEGSEYFKEQLCTYLHQSRGLRITEQNILVTRSTEMSLYIISKVMLSPGDIVVVGSLSYFATNMILQESGASMQTVPVDDNGLDTDSIRALCRKKQIRMVYVTSHHHYPTTVTLSAQRRVELLALAREFGFAIVEDDYDYEFRYDQQPILPMASADTDGMVIYLGSFGKTLAPGFRTGFTVAPDDIIMEMRKYLGIIDRQGDITMELALGEMIAEGEINRYAKKSLKMYEQRRAHLVNLLQNNFPQHVQFESPRGGLAVWTIWNRTINLSQLATHCEKLGLHIPRNLLYQHKDMAGMRIGFGRMDEGEMSACIDRMQSALHEMDRT
ncbi:PLP-dependent aminotransferase family protein [Sphingobacterium sp. lm-10]|uniref:aminotransferase-like domain-containing protein n=1 Tax=Sphingobacterium sp. lm-10 TaxID=2944904 RepID=UPI002021BB53|nr:PLP-dependent aminotransferase family protein [Sphingobacterium sp. lm-10]MCL7986466.1 PLP-dependent aminotransferase family protein [Sphingobacterium sp. lm-10]